MRDGSIRCQLTNKRGRRDFTAADRYSVELVTPVLTYEKDIETLQEVVRTLRKAGAFTNDSCGIHIHLDGKGHTVRSLRNLISIIYARNDLFYNALGINSERARYCKALDGRLVKDIRLKNPKTMKEHEDIWYNGASESSRRGHYNDTRYHFLNLHSFFHGNKTVELRGFNSTLHAGIIRAYIVFALAIDNQARVQKAASTKKPQAENEKFAMRTYLNRIGLIGDEFKACRNPSRGTFPVHQHGDTGGRHEEQKDIHSLRKQYAYRADGNPLPFRHGHRKGNPSWIQDDVQRSAPLRSRHNKTL